MKKPLTLLINLVFSISFAIVCCHAQAASDPPATRLERARDMIERGDLAAARQQLEQALKAFPAEANFYNLLGVIEAQQHNRQAAEANFRRAIELSPRSAGAYLNLGRFYQQQSRDDQDALTRALETYQRLLTYQPHNAEANYQSAVLLQHRGEYQSSQAHLARLPTAAQQRSQALALICANHAALGDLAQAEEGASRLLSRSELAEQDVVSILPVLERRQATGLQVKLLEGLLDRQLLSREGLHRLALLYERVEQFDRALQTLEKLAAAQGNSVALLLELGRVAHRQRDYTRALGYLAQARDLDPQNAGVHFFFGMICVDLDLGSEADSSLSRAVQLDPDNPYYNYALGAVALHRRDPSEAVPYFQKYRQLKPQDPRGRFALGSAYFHSSDFASARRELLQVSNVADTAAGSHYFLARMARQEDKLEQAAEHIEKSIQANSNYADAYAELGMIRLRQKQYREAEKALVRALDLDADNYLANLNLLTLYRRTRDQREDAQARRFEAVKAKRSERSESFLRAIEIRPY